MNDKKVKLVRKFSIPKNSLSQSEHKVLSKLEKAAELTATLYKAQINDKYLGANFYPHDASKEEILKAAKDNPLILNPYTVVERDKTGHLEAIPYHIKYAKLLKPVINNLREAALLTANREFSKRLEVQADALENGSYEAADIYWLTMKPYKIDIIIGPIERYEDRLLFKKTCYSANVGVMNTAATKDALSVKEAMLSAQRKSFSLAQKVEASRRLQVRIDHAVILAGLDARALFAATFLPNDPDIMERYGSEIIIYSSVVKENFDSSYLPVFQKAFEPSFQKRYNKQLLLEASQRLLLIRELSVSLVKYHDTQKRLGELYGVMNEISSHVLAVKNAGALLLKDVINQKELEAIMVMLLCRAFAGFLSSERVKSLTHYSQGYAIAINYFLENGAIREYNGIPWINFTKMFVALNDLAAMLERILAFGDIEDARRLIREYGNISTALRLSPRI